MTEPSLGKGHRTQWCFRQGSTLAFVSSWTSLREEAGGSKGVCALEAAGGDLLCGPGRWLVFHRSVPAGRVLPWAVPGARPCALGWSVGGSAHTPLGPGSSGSVGFATCSLFLLRQLLVLLKAAHQPALQSGQGSRAAASLRRASCMRSRPWLVEFVTAEILSCVNRPAATPIRWRQARGTSRYVRMHSDSQSW